MQKLKLQEEAEKARELELEEKKILSTEAELEDKQKVDWRISSICIKETWWDAVVRKITIHQSGRSVGSIFRQKNIGRVNATL